MSSVQGDQSARRLDFWTCDLDVPHPAHFCSCNLQIRPCGRPNQSLRRNGHPVKRRHVWVGKESIGGLGWRNLGQTLRFLPLLSPHPLWPQDYPLCRRCVPRGLIVFLVDSRSVQSIFRRRQGSKLQTGSIWLGRDNRLLWRQPITGTFSPQPDADVGFQMCCVECEYWDYVSTSWS